MQLLLSHMFLSFMGRTSPLNFSVCGCCCGHRKFVKLQYFLLFLYFYECVVRIAGKSEANMKAFLRGRIKKIERTQEKELGCTERENH